MSASTQIPPSLPAAPGGRATPESCFNGWEHRLRERGEPKWVFPIRKAGLARFAELGYPTLKHEDWRFTNLASLANQEFRPALRPGAHPAGPETLAGLVFSQLPGDRLVFVDGHFSPALSRRGSAPAGVIVTNLAAALANDGAALQASLARQSRTSLNAPTALNDAYFTDGACVLVPPDAVVREPVHLLFLTSAGGTAGRSAHVRNVIRVGARAEVTVLETYVSLGSDATVTNTVTELEVGEGAKLEHLRFQDEADSAFHLGALHAVIGRAANVVVHSFALGAQLSRQSLHTVLDGEGLEAVLNGLYLTHGNRLADHHMVVEHARPRCASHEYFNGILAGKSRGVFHGRILVRPDAQQTDAKQTNKNILLSPEATVNTKPQLEIYADDVKCTHGATIGQLNPESVFYLRARGIPRETARRMLIHAFAGEIIDRVRCTPIRQELDQLVWERLEADEQVHVGARE
jgi:Fe-S cluster assembly protein SufD